MMKKLTLIILLIGLFALVYVPSALANGVYFSQIPEGFQKDCTLCHTSPPNLNEFGQNYKANNFDFAAVSGGTGQETPAKDPDPVKGQGEPQNKAAAKIELILPGGTITRGEKTKLQAKVTADGQPVKGTEVDFFEKTDYMGQQKVNLGTATTAENGIAEISYWPRAAAEKADLIASIDKDTVQAAGSLNLAVSGSLYHNDNEGLDVPFLGLWTVALLVAGIWAAYFVAGYKVLQIRRYAETEIQEKFTREEERSQAEA